MEAGIMAIITAILNIIYMIFKNRSQDTQVEKLTKKVGDLETSVAECHKERSELWSELAKHLGKDVD